MVSELSPGALIAGRYRVEGVLGRGGMGVVYRAVQLPMERAVALKVLRPELTGDPRAHARFEREARAASALAHPAAVVIHDFGDHEGTAYLAMELVEGVGLRALIDEGVTTAQAIELCLQLADVLAAAHGAGLVHRDLKPENVIVQTKESAPVVRVLDFGLAFLDRRGPGGRMTREGVVVGTPEYLSPEQARGEDVGPATDVYALGCVLHELVTGRPPFSGTEMDVLTKQMFAPPPPLWRGADALDVPVALDELRRAMLDKRADARPGTEEVRERLRALDPDPARARARARQDGYLGPRAERMVDAPGASRSQSAQALELGVIGRLDASVVLGLSATGIAAFAVSDEEPIGASTAVLFAPDASEAEIARLSKSGPPVLAALDCSDLPRLSAMLRAGAADVVLRPFSAADLARKIRRVARDRARRR